MTWQVFRSKQEQSQVLRRGTGKCLHYYFYFLDSEFGWSHLRVQTWMPLSTAVENRRNLALFVTGDVNLVPCPAVQLVDLVLLL